MTNPINAFCSCDECNAKIGEECSDCTNHSSRLHYFLENAPLKNRIEAQNWTYLDLPDFVKIMMLEEESSPYLSEEEYAAWKSEVK